MGIFRKIMMALVAAVGAAAVTVPSAASAAHIVYVCDPALVTPNASDCSGYYDGNVLGGSAPQISLQQEAVAELNSDFVFDGDWGAVEGTKILTLAGGNMLDFGMMLYGETIIAAHFGNVAGPAGNVTAFYLFDFGTSGVSSITLNNTQGFSNAVLYTTGAGAVPEPAVWMLLILAFGGIGFAMRNARTRRRDVGFA